MIAYLGGYAGDLLVADTDPDTGALTVRSAVTGVPDASWLAARSDLPAVYATNESEPDGAVTALDIADPARPVVLNRESTAGAAPTHLSVHPGGNYLLAANYGSGTIAVHPLASDGRIGPATDLARHDGAAPHAHQVLTDPSGAWTLAVDLGDDSVYVYGLDLAAGRLHRHARRAVTPGTGPRHLVFHPGGRYTYLICEHLPQVIVCGWDPTPGTLVPGAIVGTVPAGAPATYPGGGVLSPDARYLYTTNRGPDTVTTFAVGDEGATLTPLGTISTGGIWPRHLVLDPSGRWLYVCNQRSGTVTWLPRDPDDGRLGPAAGARSVPAVAMMMFA